MNEQRIALERRLLILSETIRLVERAFIHWEDAAIRSDELGQLAETFFAKAAEAETRSDFLKVMWELFGQLRNGHSWYFDKLASAPDGSISFSMVEMGGEWVVQRDLADVLQVGDAVVSIEGKHPSEWCKQLAPYMGTSSETVRRIRMNHILSYVMPGRAVEVEFEDQHRSRQKVILPRLAHDDERIASRQAPETEGKWLHENRVAYIRIPSFGDPKYEDRALELVREYWGASALIVDVRGNGGGSTPSRLTRLLMDRPYRWWTERSRHPEWMKKRHGDVEIRFAENYEYAERRSDWQEPAGEGERYNGRIILLADRFVGSAAEDFIMPFKDNGRATVVGERTWGSTGQPVFRHFGEDIHVAIGSIRAYMPSGEPFEGVGIAPDVEVKLTREHLYNKRDVALDKALELIDSD